MDNGMKVSLGATFSGETATVVAEAKNDGILVLTPSASSVNAIAGSDTAFRVCFNDPYQGIAAAKYIKQYNLGTKVAAFYASDNDYCVGLFNSFKTECDAQGIQIVTEQTFIEATKTDFSTQINAIKTSGADVVFMPIYAADAANFLTQSAGKLTGLTIFGCDGIDGLLSKINDVKYANGVLMLTPFTADSTEANVTAFVTAYKAKYNNEIPDQFAADGYDAIYTVMEAIKKANLSSTDTADFNTRIVAAMTQITVNGLTGSMQWTADGETTKAIKLMTFDNGVVIPYKTK
jgi:branched-chain amino acid transport system substrate-binding protein